MPNSDGFTRREILKEVDEECPSVNVPHEGQYIWDWFFDLHASRRYTDGGAEAISFGEMEAWKRLMCVLPSPDEIEIIRAMDAMFIKTYVEELSAMSKRGGES